MGRASAIESRQAVNQPDRSRIRRSRIGLTCATLALAVTHGASAQSLGPERKDIRDFSGDIGDVMLSPFHANQRDILPVAGALAAFGLTSRVDSALYAWMTTHDRTAVMQFISPMREGAKQGIYEMGSGQYLLPLSGALYLSGRLSHSIGLRDAGLGCAAGHLTSLGLRLTIYGGVRRERPRKTTSPFHIGVPGTRFFHV
ncbi:MAG TPA: hypothetical protein VIV65_01155, partial [Gemmatimonadaceae bacterium]